MLARLRIGSHVVYPDLDRVRGPAGDVHLEPRSMDVLCMLARHAGDVVPRREILDQVWAEVSVDDGAVTRCIADIRRALGDSAGEQRVIQTIPKRGYRLVAECREDSSHNGNGSPPLCSQCRAMTERVLASTSEHVYVFDRHERYLVVSASGARAFGLEPHEMIGRTWREVGLSPEIMAPFDEGLRAALHQSAAGSTKIEYPTIDGIKKVEYRFDSIVELGEVVAVVAVVESLS